MLTFLRRIRRSLIESSAFRKYFLYAIGEVALVVFGILIALQINNWNEQRKTEAKELRLLQGLYNTMEDDIKGWNFIMRQNKGCNRSYEIIMNHIDNRLPYSDTLDNHFNKTESWWYHPLNKSAFETSKNYGLNFISNDELVWQISDLYERLHGIYDDVKEFIEEFHFSESVAYTSDNFKKSQDRNGIQLSPLSYESLINDNKYHYIINQKLISRNNLLTWQQRMLDRMDSSMKLIEEEMHRYK